MRHLNRKKSPVLQPNGLQGKNRTKPDKSKSTSRKQYCFNMTG